MTRFLRAAIFVTLIFSANGAFAAGTNWYVRKGATGANNGSSWTNAWNEMDQINLSTVACGDTIWLAGGIYTTTLAINKTCTVGSILTMNRVLSTDAVPVAAAGWNSSFDSQVEILNANISMQGAYVTIDGRVGTVAGNNFGIQVLCGPNSNGCKGVDEPAPANHFTFAHVELFGPACAGPPGDNGTCTNANGAHGLHAVNTTDSLLFDHGWVHRWAVLLYAANWTNCTIQYSQLDSIAQIPTEHEDMIFVSGPITNFTLRYNKLFFSPNDGIFFFGNETNTQMYGNVYYHSGGGLIEFYPGFTHNVFIYNNVFEDDGAGGDFHPSWLYFIAPVTMTGAIENNVFEHVTYSGSIGGMTSDYNAFSTDVGKQDSGTHSFTYNPVTLGSSILFINESPSNPGAADFHLTTSGGTTLQHGLSLPPPYNLDPDGNSRGANAQWYIGAYTFGASSSLQPPSNLVITVH